MISLQTAEQHVFTTTISDEKATNIRHQAVVDAVLNQNKARLVALSGKCGHEHLPEYKIGLELTFDDSPNGSVVAHTVLSLPEQEIEKFKIQRLESEVGTLRGTVSQLTQTVAQLTQSVHALQELCKHKFEHAEVKIVCKHSGKVFDVSGGEKHNGTHITQWDSHNGPNQRFMIEYTN